MAEPFSQVDKSVQVTGSWDDLTREINFSDIESGCTKAITVGIPLIPVEQNAQGSVSSGRFSKLVKMTTSFMYKGMNQEAEKPVPVAIKKFEKVGFSLSESVANIQEISETSAYCANRLKEHVDAEDIDFSDGLRQRSCGQKEGSVEDLEMQEECFTGRQKIGESFANEMGIKFTKDDFVFVSTAGTPKGASNLDKSKLKSMRAHDVLNYFRRVDDVTKTDAQHISDDPVFNRKKNYSKGTNEIFVGENVEEVLDEALKDFSAKKKANENYLFVGDRAGKNRYQHKRDANPEIKTLEEALEYFELTPRLKELETSLDKLRKRKITKEEHEGLLKQTDKEIQKLSFRYHPDTVMRKGGTEEEIASAQKLQTALNATRTVLTNLNSAFLEDISTDHRYGFYTKLSIDSLGNEDEIKNRVYEVLFQIGLISEIKQKNIISEIRKFLTDSKCCIKAYFTGIVSDFEKYLDSALFHLKCCVKGYKKLRDEFQEVLEQCKLDKSDNIVSLILKMDRDSRKNLMVLKGLKKLAKKSLAGSYQFFNPTNVDSYFVLPFVAYVNVILMCNEMMRNVRFWEKYIPGNYNSQSNPAINPQLNFLLEAYYLTFYYSGNSFLKFKVVEIMTKSPVVLSSELINKTDVSKEEVQVEFFNVMENIDKILEELFKVEDYTDVSPKNLFWGELKECMNMMSEFKAKEQELSSNIKRFTRRTEEMEEKLDRYDRIIEQTEEFNKKVLERLEINKKLSEKVSTSLRSSE